MSVSPFQLIVFFALFFLALGAGSTYLMMRVRELNARIQALESAQAALPATQVAGTCDAGLTPARGGKRMPYEAAEEVLDAMAVLDAAEQKDLLQLEYVRNVKAHLAKALQTGTKRSGAIERDESEL